MGAVNVPACADNYVIRAPSAVVPPHWHILLMAVSQITRALSVTLAGVQTLIGVGGLGLQAYSTIVLRRGAVAALRGPGR